MCNRTPIQPSEAIIGSLSCLFIWFCWLSHVVVWVQGSIHKIHWFCLLGIEDSFQVQHLFTLTISSTTLFLSSSYAFLGLSFTCSSKDASSCLIRPSFHTRTWCPIGSRANYCMYALQLPIFCLIKSLFSWHYWLFHLCSCRYLFYSWVIWWCSPFQSAYALWLNPREHHLATDFILSFQLICSYSKKTHSQVRFWPNFKPDW